MFFKLLLSFAELTTGDNYTAAKEYHFDCHAFFQELALNSWKVVFVFVPFEINLKVSFMHESVTLFIMIMCLFYTHRH